VCLQKKNKRRWRKVTEEAIFWIITAVVLVFDLILVAVKASYSYVKLPQLLNLREGREQSVDRAVKVIEKPQLKIGLRLALMLTHFLLAGLIPYLAYILAPGLSIWLLLLILMIGMIVLTILEFLVESLALKQPEENAIRVSPIGAFINFVFLPLSSLVMKILGKNANIVTIASMTEEDLRNWVEVGQAEGSLEKGEREMIYSIFQFGDTLAKDIMVPRIDILALDIMDTLGDARATFENAGHSRVPVYEDTIDNVVGLLYAKDLLSINKDDDLIANHRELLRLAYFVPEVKKVDELLTEMQVRSMHMAIVVDEYGGVAGLVTLEDIVEEIVGEIRDEYDESEEMPFSQLDQGEYIFLGRVDLDIFNDVMGTEIATENADTIGGFIYGEIGDVPTGGEVLEADGVTLTVDEVVGRRITKVRAKRVELQDHEKDEKDVER
jgi:CBS domain containing-hemolysin-like protein